MAVRNRSGWVAGVDGCRAGWIVVLIHRETRARRAKVITEFSEISSIRESPDVVAVDIPIGLPSAAEAGGRACERQARRLLRGRASSIFSSPARAALDAFRRGAAYPNVSAANLASSPAGVRLSKQTFNILSKIDEVDAIVGPAEQTVVHEVHPELCFTEANGGRPMAHRKKDRAGLDERAALLQRLGFADPLRLLGDKLPKGVAPDDLLDACIACWTADRIASGSAIVIPASPPTDPRGLRMELWR